MYKKIKFCHNNNVTFGGIMKTDLKKYQDVKLKNRLKNQKLEYELGKDYFELSTNDINNNTSQSSRLVELSEKSLNSQFNKPNN